MRGLAAACVALAACGAAAPAPVAKPQPQPRPQPETGTGASGGTASKPASQEEQLAAIQKAMNDLAPAVQQCWAAAAAVRLDVEGRIVAQIEIGRGAKVSLVEDTARNARLAACVQALLTRYPWAPPLVGQTIQLPFEFTAPDGQSVIDRRLVPWHGQGAVSIAVLLDDDNTGNDGASMFEVAIAAGGETGARRADRAELWYALDPLRLDGRDVPAGELIYVPAGGVRDVGAGARAAHAMLVVVPGGREGSARAGALPTPEASAPKRPSAIVLGAGPLPKGAPWTAGVIALAAGATLAPPPAPGTTLCYVLAGTGTLTIAGAALPIGPTSAIQIPPGTSFSLVAGSPLRAVHVITTTR